MSNKPIAMAFAVMLFVVAFAVSANALPQVDYVRINGDIYQDGDQLVIEGSEMLDIRVRLTAMEDERDVEIVAEILGYEYNRYNPIYDRVALFDMKAGDSIFKTLKLDLPLDAERDYYDLRIRIAGRTGPAEEMLLRLRVAGERHQLVINDVTFNPTEYVQSGRAFLAQVRLENYGAMDQRDVRVTVSMPKAGVSATDYVDLIRSGEALSSDRLVLRVPDCLASGSYEVVAHVSYNRGFSTDSYTTTLNVVTDEDLCRAVAGDDGRIVMTLATPSDLVQGERTIVPIVLTNDGNRARTVLLDVKGTADWATVSVSPSSVLVVPAQGSATAYVTFDVRENAPAGAQLASVTLTDSSGAVLAQSALAVQIAESESRGFFGSEGIRRWLEISLLVLVVLLILLGIIVALSRMRGDDERRDDEGTQTYY